MSLLNQTTLFTERTNQEKLIDVGLLNGPNVAGGKKRIRKLYTNTNRTERVEGISREYGIGGSSGPNIPRINYDSKGWSIRFKEYEINLTWNQRCNCRYRDILRRF